MKSTFSLLLFLTSGSCNSTFALQVEIDSMFKKRAIAKEGRNKVQLRKNSCIPHACISVDEVFP